MASDPGAVIDLIFGRWKSQILYAGVSLGVFEALRDGPNTAAAVTRELGLDEALGYRLMRALGCLELLDEEEDQRFSLAEAGRFLLADHPQTLRGMALLEEGPEHYALWKHLPAMVRDGEQNAFVREFGRMAFEHAVAEKGYASVFDEAMSSYSAMQTAWAVDALAGAGIEKIKTICDVAGGHGHLACGLLKAYPNLSGVVLERPEVIQDKSRLWAGKLGLEARCRYVAGNMFEEVPPADAYTMKLILHDWNDEECVRILRTIHRFAPDESRVFIIEHLITEPGVPHFSKLFDIHMMCWGTGRERTATEYAKLLYQAGWTAAGTRYPREGAMGVVEGAKNVS